MTQIFFLNVQIIVVFVALFLDYDYVFGSCHCTHSPHKETVALLNILIKKEQHETLALMQTLHTHIEIKFIYILICEKNTYGQFCSEQRAILSICFGSSLNSKTIRTFIRVEVFVSSFFVPMTICTSFAFFLLSIGV